jgi:hypothetical protein
MEISKTNKGLIAVAALSVVVYLAFKNIYKGSPIEKMIGEPCNPFGGGPSGSVIYDFPMVGMISENNPPPSLKCKRCNDTGCRQEDIN